MLNINGLSVVSLSVLVGIMPVCVYVDWYDYRVNRDICCVLWYFYKCLVAAVFDLEIALELISSF